MNKSVELSFTYDLGELDSYIITEARQRFINTLEAEGVPYKLTTATTADEVTDVHPKACNCPRCVEIPEAMQDLGPNSSESWEIQKDECGVPLMPESVVTGPSYPVTVRHTHEEKPTADLLIPVQLVGKTFATRSAGHIKVLSDGTVEASISPEYADEFQNADYVSMALKRLGE